MVSSSSHPTGRPVEVMSMSSCRAIRRPLLILNELSRSGSLEKEQAPKDQFRPFSAES